MSHNLWFPEIIIHLQYPRKKLQVNPIFLLPCYNAPWIAAARTVPRPPTPRRRPARSTGGRRPCHCRPMWPSLSCRRSCDPPRASKQDGSLDDSAGKGLIGCGRKLCYPGRMKFMWYTHTHGYTYIYIYRAKSVLIITIILINAFPSPKICQYYFPLGPKLPSQ